MNEKQLTGFGVAVKMALLEKKISQKDFCQAHSIPENRMSEILYGVRPGKRYRDKIAKLLGIEQEIIAS
ncbi:hypothetical protein DCCM_3222 [Desulfocucumis palustris]|uniref:HTH cro/C1-type domain-containing protein n=1 Tax=Desulfocucumis palustris TaxID=1898651 RepID=A0A2L2XD80_9FIRM|nr:Rha family transcriptional regulator [Desulfocucumis palustris]GBF34110.1 hypothetical protein DCCM_3222 [Desulfocucumis palustris]